MSRAVAITLPADSPALCERVTYTLLKLIATRAELTKLKNVTKNVSKTAVEMETEDYPSLELELHLHANK